MQVQITARHFKANDELQAYVNDRVAKLKRYYDGITNVHVILDLIPVQNNSTHECEADISLSVYKQRLAAKALAATHEEAVNDSLANIRRQIIRYKDKLRRKHKFKEVTKAAVEVDREPQS